MPSPARTRAVPIDPVELLPAGVEAPLALRALEAAGTGVCIADAQRPRFPLVWANEAFVSSTGYARTDIESGSCRILHWPEIDPAQMADMLVSLRAGNARQITLQHRRRPGTRGTESRISFSPVHDDRGNVTHLIGVQDAIIGEGPAEDPAWSVGGYDPLTGLPNRTVLYDRISQALQRLARHEGTLGLMFIDFDGFKHINDLFGHEAGDRFLREVPGRLASAIRADDTLARLGGDEFVLLCQDVGGEDGVAAVARRVLQAFEEPFALGEERLSVRVSVGIALAESPNETPEALLQNADVAMYRAKRDGGDGYEIFDGELRDYVNERVRLARDLRAAIGTDQLSLHYQPIVDLGTQRVSSVEALLRWNHPERGPVGPDEFVPLAEETGIIVELGRWVLDRACTEFASALSGKDHKRIDLAVNLSPRQLADEGLAGALSQILDRTGLAPNRLALEITETALTRDSDAPAAALWALKQLGTRIVLDDFGSGYSSLGHLRRFPIDVIKIDRSFIAGLGTESPDAAIVGAILPMARALDLKVVAEGVETETKLAHLYALGCRQAQGFLFARPTPIDELADAIAGAASVGATRVAHPGLQPYQARFKAALASGDAEAADVVIQSALAEGFEGLAIQAQVIGPALHHIGDEWELGRMGIAEEHLATAIAERSLAAVFKAMTTGTKAGKGRVLLAAPEGEHHVLGLRMTSDALAAEGFDVVYLGSDVPEASLMSSVARYAPDAVCLTATIAENARSTISAVRRLRSRHPELTVVAGGPAVPEAALRRAGASVAGSVEDAVRLVGEGAERFTGVAGLAAAS